MKTSLRLAFASALVAIASPAMANPVTDCPLRDMPFSADSPLVDVLLNDQARAAVEQAFAFDFDTMPPLIVGTEPPTFAAILNIHVIASWIGKAPEDVERADAALRELQVTDADREARCARYDNDVPEFTLTGDGPKLLLFEKINGFRDGPSVDAAHAAIIELAQENGWEVVTTQMGGAFNAETLSQFDAVIWNNISGDVLTLSQRQAMRDFIENGGGFVAMHGSGGDPVYFWDWYADTLIGARFAGHPRDPQFQEARVAIADPGHPAAQGLPAEWRMTDEWYSFKTNPRDSGSRIIATLDESTYDPAAGIGADLSMGEDHPIAWSRIIGKGRMFYSAIGHRPETYSQPQARALLEQGIAWGARILPDEFAQ